MLPGTEAGLGHHGLLVSEFIPEITGGREQIVVSDEVTNHARRKPLPPGEFRTSSVHAPVRVFIHPLTNYVPRVEARVRAMSALPPSAHRCCATWRRTGGDRM